MRLFISLIFSLLFLFASHAELVKADVPMEVYGSVGEEVILSPEELRDLIGRIALYPDDLLALILPASTYPVQIVQAARFLERKVQEPTSKLTDKWDSSVVGLLNYPEVLEMMNDDLDWTWKLGIAVTNQNEKLLEAIQEFRQLARATGNLESDDKQRVIEKGRTIIIEPDDPEEICIPDYDPEVVIVRYSDPVIYEYSDPYPIYYYPSSPYPTILASFFISYGFDWYNYRIHRRYHRDRYFGKRSYITKNWRPRHHRVGRSGKRFVNSSTILKKLGRGSGNQFRGVYRRGHQRPAASISDPKSRVKELAHANERRLQKRNRQNKRKVATISQNQDTMRRKNRVSTSIRPRVQKNYKRNSKRNVRAIQPNRQSRAKGRRIARNAGANRRRSLNQRNAFRSSRSRMNIRAGKRQRFVGGRTKFSAGNVRSRAPRARIARGRNQIAGGGNRASFRRRTR